MGNAPREVAAPFGGHWQTHRKKGRSGHVRGRQEGPSRLLRSSKPAHEEAEVMGYWHATVR